MNIPDCFSNAKRILFAGVGGGFDMTQEEILDRIVEIIETYPTFTEEVKKEWRDLNYKMRELHELSYGLGFWHKGYEIELHGSKIFYCKKSIEEYEDMLGMFAGKMTIDQYNEKWNPKTVV